MSFSYNVKEELLQHDGKARHCMLAGLAAILRMEGWIELDRSGKGVIYLQTDNVFSVRKCFTILKKAFNIEADVRTNEAEIHEDGRIYRPLLISIDQVMMVLKALRLLDDDETLRIPEGIVSPFLLHNQCCRRAFLRDMFLCVGSVSDPGKSYHLEYVCDSDAQAGQMLEILESFDLRGRVIRRKKYSVVYLKESEEIVDLLGIMEAPRSLMEMENLRIYKEMRGSVNRRVNCEAANITKTVNAASRQVEDIQLIERRYGFNKLSEGLREIAEMRLDHPEASLIELGKMLNPPVGKSGVNHRLRKLSELAGKLREDSE
jgi:DNA-binding protein WhiA